MMNNQTRIWIQWRLLLITIAAVFICGSLQPSVARWGIAAAGTATTTAPAGNLGKEIKVESISGIQSLVCTDTADSVTLTAVLTDNATLPAGQTVTWAGDAEFSGASGLTVTAKFAGHVGDDRHVSAKIGNQEPVQSAAYSVADATPITGVTKITYSFTGMTIPAGYYGMTRPDDPVSDITAYFAHSDHKWHCKISTATDLIRQSSSLAGRTEITTAACTSQAIYRAMLASIAAHGEGAASTWYMLEAVKAHEKVHSDLWQTENDKVFATFRSTVEALTVSYAPACNTATKAKTAIKALGAYTTAEAKYINDGTTAWITTCSHPAVDAACYAAEEGVTHPMKAQLDAKAAAQTPPWTP